MKLIDKFSIWQILITSFVLTASGFFTFYMVQKENDEEIMFRLQSRVETISQNIKEGVIADTNFANMKILEITDPSVDEYAFKLIDTSVNYYQTQNIERLMVGRTLFSYGGKKYLVEVSDFVLDSDETFEAVIKSVGWILLFFLLIMIFLNRQIAKSILKPFKHLLKSIQQFRLNENKTIQLVDSNVEEFSELNQFLKTMTDKALDDYRMLKEFTENSSHELQTPLAVIRGKLELLMESDINEEQAQLITTAYDSIEKLSRINSALSLLWKIENKQFISTDYVDVSIVVKDVFAIFSELLEMKSIDLQKDINDKVLIRLHPDLAHILITNLVKNAISHNIYQGVINVSLTDEKLIIQNTGETPSVPVENMFQRFKKNNQSSDSIGLGLAIVNEICRLHGFNISYIYKDSLHTITIYFKPNNH